MQKRDLQVWHCGFRGSSFSSWVTSHKCMNEDLDEEETAFGNWNLGDLLSQG